MLRWLLIAVGQAAAVQVTWINTDDDWGRGAPPLIDLII